MSIRDRLVQDWLLILTVVGTKWAWKYVRRAGRSCQGKSICHRSCKTVPRRKKEGSDSSNEYVYPQEVSNGISEMVAAARRINTGFPNQTRHDGDADKFRSYHLLRILDITSAYFKPSSEIFVLPRRLGDKTMPALLLEMWKANIVQMKLKYSKICFQGTR